MSKEETSPTPAAQAVASPKATSPVAASPATSPRATSPAAAAAVASPTTTSPASPTPGATTGVPLVPSTDPKVAELQSMFPTVDVGVIEMVLESVSGSQDRAIESLLQMTDPDFKPEETAATGPEENSQVDLDAEFARALALQDQEDARAESRRHRHGSREQQTTPGQLQYQPRVRQPRRAHVPAAEDHAGTRDLPQSNDQIAAFEDKAAQFVESGRQTFNTIFNRVKTKYTEYQTQTAQSAELRAQQHQHEHEQYEYEHGLGTEQPAQGYDTRPTPVRSTSATSSQVSSQDSTPIRTRWNASDSYDEQAPRAGQRSPANAGDKAAVGKIDLAKLGFLPKKRVDLMSSQQDRDPNPTLPGSGPSSPTATTPTTANRSLMAQIPKTPPAETSHHTLGDSDDDDDLDYTRNPFDEKEK